MTVKELYLEVEKEYSSVLEGKKLNKRLSAQAEILERKLDSARNMINAHIDGVIEVYTSQLNLLNEELKVNDAKMATAKNREIRRNEVEKLISEKGVTDELIKEFQEMIKDIESFILDMDKVVKEITNNEKEASLLIKDFHKLLLKNSASKALNGDIASSNYDSKYSPSEMLAMLMLSFEDEGLVENPLGALNFKMNVERRPYKKIRNYLEKDELVIADRIHKIYCDNMEKKAIVKNKVKEYLDKYDIDRTGIEYAFEMFKILYGFSLTLYDIIDEDKALLKEKELLDNEALEALIKELKNTDEKVKEEIERYVDKINCLRMSQIKG